MDTAQFNQKAKEWGRKVGSEIKATGKQKGIVHRSNSPSKGSSIDAIRTVTGQRQGLTYKIRFIIRRSLVWTSKGVGKDTPIEKAGQTNRVAKPFLSEPIEDNLEELAEMVGEHYGHEITKRLSFNL
jgi:hypothetical protein